MCVCVSVSVGGSEANLQELVNMQGGTHNAFTWRIDSSRMSLGCICLSLQAGVLCCSCFKIVPFLNHMLNS